MTCHKRDASTYSRAIKKCIRSKRKPKVVRVREEVKCAEWHKRRPPQALRDMRADGEEVMGVTEELHLEMKPWANLDLLRGVADSRGCYTASHIQPKCTVVFLFTIE